MSKSNGKGPSEKWLLTPILMAGLLLLLLVGVIWFGIAISSHDDPTAFYSAFSPNLWASMIGISVASIVGIPIGLFVNSLVGRALEAKKISALRRRFCEVLKHVVAEIKNNETIITRNLGWLRELSGRTQSTVLPWFGDQLRLSDAAGTLFHSLGPVEFFEYTVVLEIEDYYSKVRDMNSQVQVQQITQVGQRWDSGLVERMNHLSQRFNRLPNQIEEMIERVERNAT